ncbi:hypothetical protein [Bacillus cereus]|uniref:hypothetical protein n=1 Tax=Bacillus cereus TaxID=1396 RepID=UPI0030EDE728
MGIYNENPNNLINNDKIILLYNSEISNHLKGKIKNYVFKITSSNYKYAYAIYQLTTEYKIISKKY